MKSMRVNNFKLGFMIILFLLLFAFIPINYLTHDKIISVEIVSAYYADLDNNGDEHDIRINLFVSFLKFNKDELTEGINYGYILELILPSGRDFSYVVEDYETREEFRLQIDLINHAVELGWYEVLVAGFYVNLDPNKPFITTYLEFDPPGGFPGGKPQMIVTKPGTESTHQFQCQVSTY